jgi:hypothetical protein
VAYLWNYIYDGYSLSPYEDESYTFSANLSMVNGGQYCEGTRSIHEYQDSVRVLPYTYSCTPSQGAGALQVSELKDMSAKVSWSTNLARDLPTVGFTRLGRRGDYTAGVDSHAKPFVPNQLADDVYRLPGDSDL